MNLAKHFVLNNPKCALFLPMGHGKTQIVLEALMELRGELNRVLIAAPKAVALRTWPDEIARCNIDCTYSLIDGNPEKRMLAAAEPSYIHIIGVDSLVWLIENTAFDYDAIVIDESTKFKSVESLKYEELNKVINNPFSLIERVIIMSGTPVGNTYLNLWSQISLLDDGERLGTYRQYVSKFFVSRGPYSHYLRNNVAEIINELVSDICYNEPDEDIERPDEIPHVIPVELDRETREIYVEIRNNLLYEFKDRTQIDAANAAVAMNKLLQVCSGHCYIDRTIPGDLDDPDNPFRTERDVRRVHTNKLDALKGLRASIDEPVIIAINYIFERDILLKEFPDAKALTPDNIKAWNRGEISELILHPKSAGHGLNLQFGGRHIIWYTLTWSVEDYLQTNARITRRGQPHKETHIHHLISQVTIEAQMMRVLETRRGVQDDFMESIVRDELFA